MKSKIKKLVNFGSEQLSQLIQDYANKNHNGNFNAAVRDLCEKQLNEKA